MTTYQQYQQQLAQDLIHTIDSARPPVDVRDVLKTGLSTQLEALIDAFPYYGDPDWDTAHRGALANLLEINVPNNRIEPQPMENGFGYSSSYFYNGSFSGYRDAFFHGIGQTGAAARVASLVQGVNGTLNGGWWGNYAVVTLTDAVRQRVSIALDSAKLTSDLTNYNRQFLPALSASYLAVFQAGYSPTATTLNAIISAGQGAAACTTLTTAIAEGQFTADINEAIAMGGDSTNAAVWFLYNLWITLHALGSADVDGAIRQFQSAGLTVPSEVGPGNWWNGGYTSWYHSLSGSDVVSVASGTITAGLPEEVMTVYVGDPPSTVQSNTSVSNGYAQSLCTWGSLNWYKPQDPSCFGQGTGVLMADGSVKPIERVQLGDAVQSQFGPRKVVLIETPKRATRTLYQVNGLDLFVTAAHPFRAAAGSGPMRVAVDPWALIDGIPTMIAGGVGTLSAGVVLAGRGRHGPQDVTIDQLVAHDPGGEEEYVYDLLLENWEKGYATYFVGGPETFFAVDAETADPVHHLPSTAAIVAAMDVVLPHCRQRLTDPDTAVPALLTGLKLDDLTQGARAAARSSIGGKLKRPALPGPDFYMQNGAWDAHASTVEFHLVRHFGRMLRRETAMGWRSQASAPAHGDHFTVCVHDLELIGDAPIPANTPIEIQLHLRGWSLSDDIMQKIAFPAQATPLWLMLVDQVIDFGRIHTDVRPAVLIGTIKTGDAPFGRFRAAITEELLQGSRADHFVFRSSGEIVGRIALEQRRIAGRDLVLERRYAAQWTKRHALSIALSVGRHIGYKLVASMQT
jgi:hypothetical protein